MKNAYIIFRPSVLRLLVTATVVPSSQILVTLMTEAIRSSETSVLTRATRPTIPDDDILLLCLVEIVSPNFKQISRELTEMQEKLTFGLFRHLNLVVMIAPKQLLTQRGLSDST
jgi:hypothetical protein